MSTDCDRCGADCCKEVINRYFKYRDDGLAVLAFGGNEKDTRNREILQSLVEKGLVKKDTTPNEYGYIGYALTEHGGTLSGKGLRQEWITKKPQPFTTYEESRWENAKSWD